MWDRDPTKLMRRVKQALEHIHATGKLHRSDLQLPIYPSPQYFKRDLKGYQGGVFDPLKLGAAYLVVPPLDGSRGPNTSASWNLNQVSPALAPFLTACLPSSISI